jgi:membrane-associated phospholipid phosphatase
LELSYLLCYPLVPQGLGVLYLARPLVATPSAHRGLAAVRVNGFGAVVDQFWTTVLLAALSCYVIYPFFPLTPPRVLFHDLPGPAVEPLLRKINFWILDRYSVQACIFPSGHVAAVTATALAVRAYLPRLGVVFLTAATSIAIATVYGRYHYTADAMAGALVAIAAFWTSRRICVR